MLRNAPGTLLREMRYVARQESVSASQMAEVPSGEGVAVTGGGVTSSGEVYGYGRLDIDPLGTGTGARSAEFVLAT